MPRYSYIALDARGQESTGVIDAESQNDAVAQLRSSGFFPKNIAEEGKLPKMRAKTAAVKSTGKKGGKSLFAFMQRKTVKPKTLMIFSRQLATLISAGLPLLRGLTVLAKQEPDPVLKSTILSLAETVQGGGTFSESLAGHPLIFNKLYINMVKAGELGGVLELVLQRLAEFQEKAQKIKNKIAAAMYYPLIVLVIAILILVFLLLFIVPKFQAIFADMLGGKPLPGLTQFVIGASNMVQHQAPVLVAVIIALVVVFKIVSKTPRGVVLIDRLKMFLPIVGDLVRKGAIGQFCRTLGTLVTSGVPILQALNIARETAGNAVISDAISKVHDSVKEGDTIVKPLEASGVFPPMVVSMVDVGEETGQLPDMLLKIAEVFDDEVDTAVEGLTSMLEPIMIVFLAVIVGTIVIALFLPLISIITGMSDT